jgi:hypothetical protein
MTDAPASLHAYIVAHYNLEELRTLCFKVGVDFDNLTGEGLSGRARELILTLERKERLADLFDRLRRDHPALYAQANLGDDLPAAAASGPEQGQPAADQPQVGGIRAGRIEAENVVSGVQQIGGNLADAAEAVALAEALRQGSITADSIQARNVVAGFQYIADPAQATADELRREVARLRQELAAAIATGEVAQTADVKDAREALDKAEAELAEEAPQGGRVIRKLREAADILAEGARTAEAARQAGQALLKLAPAAAALYQIASQLFGG